MPRCRRRKRSRSRRTPTTTSSRCRSRSSTPSTATTTRTGGCTPWPGTRRCCTGSTSAGRNTTSYLPGLHRRRQLIQLVVDGLVRYGRMLDEAGGRRRRTPCCSPTSAGPRRRCGAWPRTRTWTDPAREGGAPEPARHRRRAGGRPRRADRRARPRARAPTRSSGTRWLTEWRAELQRVDQALGGGPAAGRREPGRRGARLARRLGTADVQRPPPRRDRPRASTPRPTTAATRCARSPWSGRWCCAPTAASS